MSWAPVFLIFWQKGKVAVGKREREGGKRQNGGISEQGGGRVMVEESRFGGMTIQCNLTIYIAFTLLGHLPENS